MYYQKYLTEINRNIEDMVLYRGSKINKRDFESLKKGVFIEMFGFMSTSKNIERAKSFTDREGYIFVIHINKRNMLKKYDIYDHGFVDINRYKLAEHSF